MASELTATAPRTPSIAKFCLFRYASTRVSEPKITLASLGVLGALAVNLDREPAAPRRCHAAERRRRRVSAPARAAPMSHDAPCSRLPCRVHAQAPSTGCVGTGLS